MEVVFSGKIFEYIYGDENLSEFGRSGVILVGTRIKQTPENEREHKSAEERGKGSDYVGR